MTDQSKKSIFGAKSTAEDVTNGIDLTGKTVVITGVNSGLGFETMRVLAMRGAHVIGAARSLEKAQEACALIDGKTTPVACELSDLDSVSECSQIISDMQLPIDILICNAGIMALAELTVVNGFEKQFLCNHLGHFLLVYKLQDRLREAAAGRIVMLSSEGHRLTNEGGIDFDNLDGRKGYKSWAFYGQSKLANHLTAVAFDRRLKDQGVRANSVHPGVINTNLARDVGGIVGALLRFPGVSFLIDRFGGKSVPQGAATQCYVATNPSLDGMGGDYYSDCDHQKKPSQYGQNIELSDRLWNESEKLLEAWL